MKVLVTGGAGYLGSITAKALEEAGHVPVILDSLLGGPRSFVGDRIFYEGDIADRALVARIVEEHPDIDATIHMAARIVVPSRWIALRVLPRQRGQVAGAVRPAGEARQAADPLLVDGVPLRADPGVRGHGGRRRRPDVAVRAHEADDGDVLEDISKATSLRAIILRYFNPIGTEPDLETGYHLKDATHVVPLLAQAALGYRESFTITGTDLPTRDGTGLRDYIHAWDLAQAHVRAVERFDEVIEAEGAPYSYINIGGGDGVTVRELIAAVERVVGKPVPVTEGPRGRVTRSARSRTRTRRPTCSAGGPRRHWTKRSHQRWPGARSGSPSSATSETPLVEVRRVQRGAWETKALLGGFEARQRAASHLNHRCG